jgi:hypothetical protein
MEALTGVRGGEWLSVALLLMAVVLVLRSLPGLRDRDWGGAWIVPLVAGAVVALVVVLGAPPPADLAGRLVAKPITMVALAAIVVLAFAVVDFALERVAAWSARVMSRFGIGIRVSAAAGLLLALVPLVVGAAILVPRLVPNPEIGTIEEVVHLPDAPMGIALEDARHGFISLGRGSVVRFERATGGGRWQFRTVAEGLENPRGLAIAGGRLYLGELGPLPCQPAFPVCKGSQLAQDDATGDERILRAARGRIVSYAIGTDGSLTDRVAVVDDIPVANSEHGVNGMEVGRDGALYVSVGNLDALYLRPEVADDATVNAEWLGTILRIDPTSLEVRVHARGLRNVYELAFDAGGGLWGVDNDGSTQTGWRAEEVLRIREGQHYGFPFEGTFGPYTVRTEGPVWLVDAVGSGGLAWAGGTPLGPGLLSGSCSKVLFVPLVRQGAVWVLATNDSVAVSPVLETSDCVSTLEPLEDGTVLVGLFSYGGDSTLAVVRLRPP